MERNSTSEQTTPHSGQLPAWGRSELPSPPAFTFRNILGTVGPAVIGLGVAIGSGEWLLGPAVIVRYGPALLWITTVAVVLQVLLNIEMGRYTLYTGEPIFTGFMRTRPGPSFWGWTYGVLSFLQFGWPGWALASATATTALVLGRMPTDGDARMVVITGYATFVACFLPVLTSRKIERTLERAMWFLVASIILYLLLIDVFTVSAANWGRVLGGFVSLGSVPAGADWVLLGAFAAYSGLGGVGNAFLTNWMRDKGYGMGATVGFIPGPRGGPSSLSASGNTFGITAESLQGWRGWWRFLNVDQWGIFFVGSIAGMLLTALFTMQFVPPGAAAGEWAVAGLQATGIANVYGRLFWYLTLLCGLWILFSTQLGIVEGLPRAVTDILWSGSARVRAWRGGDVRMVYFGVLAAFAIWGCVGLNLAKPLTLVIIGANIAGVNFVVESVHTLVVNRTLLPRELRPPLWREGALVLCALFYATFVVATLTQWL